MIKGGLSFSQPDEVEVRIAVPLDTILAFSSGGQDGYLKISRATFLALLENTIQNPESDANHNIAQILFNLSKGGKTDGNVAFLV
jgi:hypothetical protein